jgi:hypothetical protein
MKKRKPSQDLLPVWSQVDEDASLIGFIPQAFDEISLYQPINQLNRTMMPKLEALGQLTNRGFPPGRQALEREQQLVLLGDKACLACRLLAKAQKAPDLITNFS